MVTPSYNPFSGRRNARAGSYPPANRRQAGFIEYPDPRGYPFWATEEEAPVQRKRIAVACGRCRKRKIRCSGDSGNGLPCTNCRNAGHDTCMYLRVASQETQIKNESFSYNLEASRQYHSRGSASTPSQNLTIDAVSSHDPAPYRTSQPPMAFNDRSFEAVSAWPAAITVDQMAFNTHYGIPIPIRGSNTMVSAPRDDASQPESTEAYTAAHVMTSLVQRPATGNSTPVITAASIAPEDSLPTPSTIETTSQSHPDVTTDRAATPTIANTERTVPTPAEGHTPAPTPISNQYLQDASSAAYVRPRGQSPVSSSSGSGPLTPSSETGTATGYTGFDYHTLPSTALPFPMMAMARTSGPIYGPSSGSATAIYAPNPAPTSSARGADMVYRYVDTTVSETGEPLVGLLQRHPSPTTEAALALTQHHRGGIYGAHERRQQPSPYVVPSNGGVSLTERECPEEEPKPAVVHP